MAWYFDRKKERSHIEANHRSEPFACDKKTPKNIFKKNEMGVSENSVPLNLMVNDHYPYQMAIIGNIPYFQTNPNGFVWKCWVNLPNEIAI